MNSNKQSNSRFFLILSIACLLLLFPIQSAYAEKTTEQPKPTLEGIVTDIVTHEPVAGATVTVAEQSCITNAKGYYSISELAADTSVMEVTGESIIPRRIMVAHDNHTTLDVTVKNSDFNNAMYWASAGPNERVRRWKTPPKWVLYTHVLDSDPPKVFDLDNRQYLFKIITKELPNISSFFENPQVELFKGRPNDDPRWTGKKSANGYILCAPARKGGGNASWDASANWIKYARIHVNYVRSRKVWRHEIGHALGMAHAFDNKKWLPLGVKDPNYELTKLHQGVFFQPWDKLWLHCVYSGSRPAGNMPPDRDPARFIHGKHTLYTDPDSMYTVTEQNGRINAAVRTKAKQKNKEK